MSKKLIGINFLAAVGLACIVGWSIWWWQEKKLELITIKNIAVGHLENNDYLKARPLFEEIVRELPDEPLGRRNLAITLFAPNDSGVGDTKAQFPAEPKPTERLLAAVDGMMRAEPKAFASHYLAGVVYKEYALQLSSTGAPFDKELAICREHFQEAAKLSPNDPAPHFQLFEVERFNDNPDSPSDRTLQALQPVLRRVPANLWVHYERLKMLANRPEAGLKQAVTDLLRILPPDFNEQILADLREAETLMANKDPNNANKAAEKATYAANRLLSHFMTQYDRKVVQPHPLAFVLTDFVGKFAKDLPQETLAPPIPVRFATIAHGPSGTGEIVACLREDLTSNGEFGTVVLIAGKNSTRVEVVAAHEHAHFPPIEVAGVFAGLALADLDWDSGVRTVGRANVNIDPDLDLVLYGPSGLRILENRESDGKRAWIDRTADAKIPALTNVRWLLANDIDHDGNIDLVVGLDKGIRIFRNRGEMDFEDITSRSSGLGELETIAAVAADFDRDGDLDIMCLTKSGKLVLLDNQRGGHFVAKEQAGSYPGAVTLLSFDANNDGRVDLLIGHATGATLLLAGTDPLPNGARVLELPTKAAVRQTGFFDYDNDGWMDVWILTDDKQTPLRLFRNGRGERFDEVTKLLTKVEGDINSIVVSDVDDDGAMDLMVAATKGVQVLRNDGGNANSWMNLRLRAKVDKDPPKSGAAAKVNYFSIGGTVEIKAGQHYQWQQIASSVTHFGLGPRKQVDVARIVWTNGVPQSEIRPATNQTVGVLQIVKASCPFLFAWNGQRFVMVTDCLWSSALGMKLAPDVYMDHHRQQNHLVITDDKLRPRNGEYVLQFTNELWELPYVDQSELWVIEHPADVEVFTNQRIGPPLDDDFRFRTVKQRRLPVAAKDHNNQDVLALLNQRNQFLGGFKRLRYYGQAEPHWLELDPGDLGQAKQATLYLSGWIWPTDTSANVAIAQDPRFNGGKNSLGGGQPPALQVPDGKGGWSTAIPNMGFPCGKMQTVVVDLPMAKFPKGDYRVRIATAMELYWNEAFFTVDEADVPLKVTKLPVAKADLHYRGFSRVYQKTPTSPFLYDYDDVDPNPAWLPIPGPYTRYGDVTELLAKPDSQYVAMSTGDELTLRFPAQPPAPAGRKHTYLFYANGWLKDFDLNGGASEQVGPLPFDGMSKYPYVAPETYPNTPEAQNFLRNYMTRQTDPARFWDALRPK